MVDAFNANPNTRETEKIPERPADSILNRWTNHIRPKSSKWAGICKLVKKKSGEAEQDVLDRRQKMYAAGPGKGKKFPHLSGYELLEGLPKWQEVDETTDKGVGKKKRKSKATNCLSVKMGSGPR